MLILKQLLKRTGADKQKNARGTLAFTGNVTYQIRHILREEIKPQITFVKQIK